MGGHAELIGSSATNLPTNLALPLMAELSAD
ncbi:hypothetical protein ABID25_000699 [Mesorhizobium abyssinicae]